ncbi:cell envelope integrity protein CreD [Christiangramia sp. SM2212]|uniref:Cell envelope integrity protein CreD n=1 Tax=Christiangramia sediminicola TaxID=3073267 RepID=A0ABU1ERJ5_9FLAO|nr:cell envelope integrity protein CreD [Christiangramia sp. SM2212]MDR5591004.1 cell envelope integrity protein CreD [Christiangramia sp. SM2212]
MDNYSPQESNASRLLNWLKNSITARMVIIGFLTLVLLIPLFMVQDLIAERAQRQKQIISEINDKWGDEVILLGPILKLPYRSFKEKHITNSYNEVTTESIEEIRYLYLFPDQLNISSQIDPRRKKRGIYQTAVYKSKNTITGNFSVPDINSEDILEENLLWDKARIVFKTSNLKGVNNQLKISMDGKEYNFSSKFQGQDRQSGNTELFIMESSVLKQESVPQKKSIDFRMNISVNGSSEISFIPIGKTTEAELSSNWNTNSFTGNFLPFNEDKMTDDGFNAKWKILDINRPFPQNFNNRLPDLTEYAFGVNFMIPVDEYQKSERATKYGFLVIGLTFLLFFLIQTLSKIPIHPFQYLMIGLGLVMFYTLLISISEHSSFLTAYLIAGISVILMISLYSKSILKIWKFPVFIGLSLIALYSFIYVIIQLESYALLVGSIGLFLILAGVMFVSRKIDWNNY